MKAFIALFWLAVVAGVLWCYLPFDVKYAAKRAFRRHWYLPAVVFTTLGGLLYLLSVASVKLF